MLDTTAGHRFPPMQYYHIILFLLAIAIAASAAAPRLRTPYPILLILAGIAVGFIPGMTYVPIEPDVVFLIFLPPLLYDASLNISFPQFRRNIGIISALAVTMVFITIAAIAVVAKYIIPGMSWPVAFVLGAILSPPDAIAATSIIKDMKLPARTRTILEGESLVNDASALTAYRIAMGVVAGGSFFFWNAGLQFVVILAGGAAIGLALAWIFCAFLRIVKLNSTATVSLNIILPFVAYQLAENFGVSGVLAVVVMGLSISKKIHNGTLFSPEAIDQSRSVWSIIIYVLSGLVFILIGVEFPQAMHEIPAENLLPMLVSAVFIFLIALAIRILFIFGWKYRTDTLDFYLRRHLHKKNKKEIRSLDWKNSLVIGWSGMRGIVSVATAIALPMSFYGGHGFVQRNGLIFITVVVVILMLLIQGLGLPVLLKLLKIKPGQDKREL